MAKTKYFGHTGADDYRIKSFLIHADDYIIIELLVPKTDSTSCIS